MVIRQAEVVVRTKNVQSQIIVLSDVREVDHSTTQQNLLEKKLNRQLHD